jgi:predicted nucleic acid-binding protein
MNVVADAGPLIIFARAHRFDMLRDVFGTLAIPTAVFRELMRMPSSAGAAELGVAIEQHWIEVRAVAEPKALRRLPRELGPGDREALELARELRARLFSDDAAVRAHAPAMHVRVFGSLGALARAKSLGRIDRAWPIAQEFVAAGHFIAPGTLDAWRRAIGE